MLFKRKKNNTIDVRNNENVRQKIFLEIRISWIYSNSNQGYTQTFYY